MKKIIISLLALGLLSLSLSACAQKPKAEDALKAFLDINKTEEDADYREYFDAKVDILETDPTQSEDAPFLNETEIQDKMTELFMGFTYEIKTTEEAKDGKSAIITVKMTTVDMATVFNSFMTDYIARAMQLAFSGGTEEQIQALASEVMLEKLNAATLNKDHIVEVKMNYNADEKKWYIEGGDTNKEFLDALTGGMISTLEQWQANFPQQTE